MFVPRTVYENAPYYWVVLGVMLIVFGGFHGKAGNMEFLVAGAAGGAFACIWGVIVFRRRLAQETRTPCSTYDEYLDQTMELNLRDIQPATGQAPADSQAPEQ